MDNIILIGGGSCSGKSTIAESIAAQTQSEIAVCSIDNYYRDAESVSDDDIIEYNNYDDPHAVDTEALIEDIGMLSYGLSVHVPVYDCKKRRKAGYRIAGPCSLVIVEGVFALHYPWLRRRASLCVFVDCKESERFYRRVKRDVEMRNLVRKDVIKNYRSGVQEMFEKFVLPSRKHAEVIVSGEESIDCGVRDIIAAIDDQMLVKG